MLHEVRIKVLGKKALYKNDRTNFSWAGGRTMNLEVQKLS